MAQDNLGQAVQARGYPKLEDLHSSAANEIVEPFISSTVEECYKKLIAESSCCLDSEIAEHVTKTVVQRPGTEWFCNKSKTWSCTEGCCDGWFDGYGDRGEDLVWTPDGATCSSPRVLYIHGGSWQYCAPDTCGYDSLASKLAQTSKAVVMVHDYPLMPVGDYWTMTAAAHKALQWLQSHGPLGQECEEEAQLFIGGDSSGGGTALSLVLWNMGKAPGEYWRSQTPHVQIAGAFFYSPWTNLMCDTPTYYHNAYASRKKAKHSNPPGMAYSGDIIFQDKPWDNARLYRETAVGYLAGHKDFLSDKVASPFYAEDEFQGGPPLYFVVSGTETITGDSMASASRAAQQGVKVYLDIFPGMWHVFPMYSEGCGTGQPLWQAELVLNRTAHFIRQETIEAAQRSGPIEPCRTNHPQTVTHYGPPLGFHPWVPVQPLRHACHVVDWTGNNSFSGWTIVAAFVGGAIIGAATFGIVGHLRRREPAKSRRKGPSLRLWRPLEEEVPMPAAGESGEVSHPAVPAAASKAFSP
eukprot:CAMPEP_0178443768 /NCGR_PEP_ID=MMETSP0689_2-20121128/39094_1 /TAXON_ID=160604 /ORGANISM="Amphidinium massartii, Strain CS-259" /LENGTH=523 /DNA_ID=CAMNT_0020067843 /DNA_START=35 /DNA_END=1603 /DNA_ORIENTATION=-